jgi:hypothetical protein
MTDPVVPAWPAATVQDRLIECRIMLYQHGMLTDAEMSRIDQRILRRALEGERESNNTKGSI